MVELWKLHLHFVPLKVVVLCLLAHGRDEVELAGHRIRLLVASQKRYVVVTARNTVDISLFHTNTHAHTATDDDETERPLTMISMALQRDVPQYMAIPWFITNVMARTISAKSQVHSLSTGIKLLCHTLVPQTAKSVFTYHLKSIDSNDLPSIGLLTSFLFAKTMST